MYCDKFPAAAKQKTKVAYVQKGPYLHIMITSNKKLKSNKSGRSFTLFCKKSFLIGRRTFKILFITRFVVISEKGDTILLNRFIFKRRFLFHFKEQHLQRVVDCLAFGS